MSDFLAFDTEYQGVRKGVWWGIVALTDFEATTQTTTLYVAGSDKMLKEAGDGWDE